MPITARIICDSISPSGHRLVTIEATYPRFTHSELMTHRAFSRNAASSRAIPVEKMLARVESDPATHVWWGANEKGMQAFAEVADVEAAKAWWMESARLAVAQARKGLELGLHKQVVNRVTEPFQHMVTVISATEWANFFHLRYHKAAEPNFQVLAKAVYKAYRESTPQPRLAGEWHCPYLRKEDWADSALTMADLRKVSVGRCARVSYLNQNGVRDPKDDIALHDRLWQSPESGDPGHWSPFEHVAQATDSHGSSGNFVGWEQYRKTFRNECTVVVPNLPIE